MAAQKAQTPWWERPAQASGRPGVDAERERLRAELARAWNSCAPHPPSGSLALNVAICEASRARVRPAAA